MAGATRTTCAAKATAGRSIRAAALGEADGPPRPPMDRKGVNWANAADQLCRLLGVEMPWAKRGSPASNRHQGDVDVRHPVKRKVRTCVPRKPAPAGALNKIAECGSAMRATRVSPAVVVGGQDAYLQAAKLHEVTGPTSQSFTTAGGDWLEQAARTCWAIRTAEAGMSRSEGRWVWSACRWETRTRSARAACGARNGPRTRRRWPSRAVRTGSNSTVVPPSRHVLVLCPHHVSVPVTARPARPSVRTLMGVGLGASRAAAAAPWSGRSGRSLSSGHPARWGRVKDLSPFCDRGRFSDQSDPTIIGPALAPWWRGLRGRLIRYGSGSRGNGHGR